ncbi:MAG: hypothetical protein [Caudoviricetes sp.]|nr:MAG: hypothetical protein [Caudoviricetes sp.]
MTDQERADLELSLSLIDQAVASDKQTKATKDLTLATNMEIDAALDVADSKTRLNKKVKTEIDVTQSSIDVQDDLNYTRHAQGQLEREHLDIMSRRVDIERKIGLVDYSQISKELHDKIAKELEEKLKLQQKENEETEETTEDESSEEERARKSDSHYRKEAEKFHKKQISIFKKISDGHASYMQNSKSFFGRMAMGTLGKGTSELMNVIDSATDMIPGAKTAKKVGGFVRTQMGEAREKKRQSRIESTAKFLRARDESPELIQKKEDEKVKEQKKGTEGIGKLGLTLEKIFSFLKKFAEMTMMLGVFKSLVGLMGSVVGGLGGIIAGSMKTALSAIGIMGVLTGIKTALTTGLAAIATKFGFKIPGLETKPDPKAPASKTPKTPDGKPAPAAKTGGFAKAGSMSKGFIKHAGKMLMTAPRVASPVGMALLAKDVVADPLEAAIPELTDNPVADALNNPPGMDYIDELGRKLLPWRKTKEEERIEELNETYKSSYGEKKLYDKTGKVQLYPNLEDDPDIKFENERRFQMAANQGNASGSLEDLMKIQNEVNVAEEEKEKRKEASRQQMINAIGQQNTVNNITAGSQGASQFGFSPYEYSSRDRYSRGEIK